MLNIAGRIFVNIQIDGNDLPHSPNLIERIIMTEGMGALSPAIELILNDYAGSLSKELALTDGNELLVTIGKTPQDLNTHSRQYRLFGMRSLTTANGPRMQIIGIYDAPGYLTGSVRESFKSTTSEVMAAIASRCKLKYLGPEKFNGRKTNDNQVWLNVAKSRAMFVQRTARHGFIDEHSAMYATLTSLGELRYLDLNEVIETPKEKIKFIFVHNTYPQGKDDEIVYIVGEAKTRSTAGLMNTWQNYGSTHIEHNLNGEKTTHEKVEVKTTAEYLPINSTVMKTVDRSRMEYSPLDCGNTNKNFNKAQYQNLKLLSLFTEHVSILTTQVTEVQQLDTVIYRQANHDPKTPVSNSDIYIVLGKSIVCQSGNYVERIELVRHNITEKGATELATEDSATTTSNPSTLESMIDPTSKMGGDSLPKTTALAAIVAPAQTALNSAKGSMHDLNNAGQFATPSLKGTTSSLKELRNGVKDARRVVHELRGTIASMKHYATVGRNFASQMKNSAQGMKDFAKNVKNYPTALRSAAMTSKRGLINTFTHSLSGVKQNLQLSALTRPLRRELDLNMDAIRTVVGGEAVVRDFNNEANRIESNSRSSVQSAASIWNSSLSVLNGKDVPETSKILRTNSTKMTTALSGIYREPVSRSTVTVSSDVAANDLTSQMLKKTSDRQPNWIPEDLECDYDVSVTKQRAIYEARGVNYDEDLDKSEHSLADMEREVAAMSFRETED